MRQLVVGIVSALALTSAGVAQARPQERPQDRPSEFGYGGGGGRGGAVSAATNPFHNVEAGALARSQQRLDKVTHHEAGRPAETGGTRDKAAASMKAISAGRGGGMAGSVKSALNPFHDSEAKALRGVMRSLLIMKEAGRPADSSIGGGTMDKAAMAMKAQFQAGGRGMAGSVKTALNVHHTAEVQGIARARERALKATNMQVSQPADPSGANDRASRLMREEYVSRGGGGGSGMLRYSLNPFARDENNALAKGLALAASRAGSDAPMPKGLAAGATRADGWKSVIGRASASSTFDLRSERRINEPLGGLRQ